MCNSRLVISKARGTTVVWSWFIGEVGALCLYSREASIEVWHQRHEARAVKFVTVAAAIIPKLVMHRMDG